MMEDVLVSAASSAFPVDFEIPKSSTFTIDRLSARSARNRFAGFRSRCTMFRGVRLGDGLARLQHEADGLFRREHLPLLEHAGEVAPLAGTP